MDSQFLGRLKLSGIFCQVVDSGSMTKAASEMNMSVSAVSQFINQLESELSTTLLYRSTRKLTLSEAGEAYYIESKKMLEAALNAQNAVHDVNYSLSGEVRISLPIGLATSVITEALSELVIHNPDLKITLLSSDRNPEALAERTDISIMIGHVLDSDMILHKLGEMSSHIFASPSYLANYNHPATPQDLTTHRWLGLRRNQSSTHLNFHQAGHDSVTIKNSLKMEFNDLNLLISHVKAGAGIAVLPLFETEDLVISKQLIKILPKWQLPELNVSALTFNKNLSHKVRTVLNALKYHLNAKLI